MSRTLVARIIANKVIHELINLNIYSPNNPFNAERALEVEDRITQIITKVLEDEDIVEVNIEVVEASVRPSTSLKNGKGG